MTKKGSTVIMGLGKTGLSCARFLAEKKQFFTIMDSRSNPPYLKELEQDKANEWATEIVIGAFSSCLLDQAEEIVISPGISLKHPLIAAQVLKGKSIIGDIELFSRHVKKPIIAITGSNGKTTVTTLVGLMMQAAGRKTAVCGNIGEPVLSQMAEEYDCYVMELSSFQLETTYSLRPDVATLLNITPDHMDRYNDLQEYTAAKQRIYHHCHYPVVNADEPETWKSALQPGQRLYSFGLEQTADFSLGANKNTMLMYQGKSLIAVSELKLQARHHLQNALAALAVGHAAGLAFEPMLSVLREFSGIKHRCQWIRKFEGVDYYNDSKGTNVGATQAALISLGKEVPKRIVLIAGGQGKGADFSPLHPLLKQYVKAVILIGEDAHILENAFRGATSICRASTLEEAIQFAKDAAESGDCVLLSPACASFDMFSNFEARGDAFIACVSQW